MAETQDVIDADVDVAAAAWVGEKDREFDYSQVIYFKENWRHLAGLRARVVAQAAIRLAKEVRE